MMAMRPPTSPTTVIGGFSLAIITVETKQHTSPEPLSHSTGSSLPLNTTSRRRRRVYLT